MENVKTFSQVEDNSLRPEAMKKTRGMEKDMSRTGWMESRVKAEAKGAVNSQKRKNKVSGVKREDSFLNNPRYKNISEG